MPKMDMKQILQIASFSVLLIGSLILGFLGKATEMGLAIGAGAIGLFFSNIDKISRFKGAGIEAEMKEQMQAIIEKETEPELTTLESGRATLEGYGLVGNANEIVLALKNPKYTWRYIGSLAKESGVPEEEVYKTLRWLSENELAKKSIRKKGEFWSLSEKGREVYANLSAGK